jgi:hypothetical protein
MRLLLPFGLAVVLLAPALASAQPNLYVCTPSAQVLTINGTTGALLDVFTGTGTYHGCVLGPDGLLYIANDNNILRLNPTTHANSFLPGPLSFTPRDLAFNVSTLYITSSGGAQSSNVYRWVATPTVNLPNTEAPLTFPAGTQQNPQPEQLFAIGSPGRGIVFDVVGNMVLASDSRLDSAAPPYGSASTLIGSGITPVGVAVNTCKDVVYADFATNAVKTVGGTTLATFSGNDKPLYIEVDSSNVMYVVTGTKLDGSGAKVWNVPFDFATTGCSAATPQLLLEIKNNLPGVNSDSAIGIAVAATNKTLTNATAYSATHCSDEYKFGYHSVTLEFTDCAASFGENANTFVTVEALKATISQTTFDTTDVSFDDTPTPIEGMRYSPMGGFIVQYRINVSGYNPPAAPVRLIYHFDTQETILAPGVAKFSGTLPTDETIAASFNKNVGTDYWEAGKLDPPAGERTDGCCSKHVVYNAGAATTNAQCSWTYDEPLKSTNPLFNGTQIINVSGSAKNGSFKCTGGTLRLSIFRYVFPTGYTGEQSCANVADAVSADFLTVISAGAQQENILEEAAAGKYKFNLDTTGFLTGAHLATISGPLKTSASTIGSLNIGTTPGTGTLKCFQFQKAQ